MLLASWLSIPEVSTLSYKLKFPSDLDYLTVRGSGHFVPGDRPREALQMIYNFVKGNQYSTPVPFL